ncbi:type I phosphodiesterase/nucleotide pyrophosphatase family protein [Tieghemostelium lacteum]|uniref:Type I phosphodiesterase/nucleotide pyrophosphatase family protein n=1 Tax=Tieghemostelium lacteum TaxID=361077 RepID=A0A151ZG11_TIELA|nr:type I phosphodiesterase/nucleotide pyrophosphatase family protein [Tieghemostelium lacteum]|eukprot:KYQ92865.1 type I phosphodiesterase/nucleotide pyrophosphatase family protein [Tieghemostelium lacteum]
MLNLNDPTNDNEFEDIDYNSTNNNSDDNPIFFTGTEFLRQYTDDNQHDDNDSDGEDREDHSFIEVESYRQPQDKVKFKRLLILSMGVLLAVTLAIVLFLIIRSTTITSSDSSSSYSSSSSNTSPNIKTTNPLIIISLDGFRWDYLNRNITPNLLSISSGAGVRANFSIPQFPSKTFPNHYSIATGLLPQYHGIINNHMWDPLTNQTFNIHLNADESYWYWGEPIWVTAEKNGLTTSCVYFPGCSATIEKIEPTYNMKPYQTKSPQQIVDIMKNWTGQYHPDLMLAYFYSVDSQGHNFGPNSQQVDDAIVSVDNAIGDLLNYLKNENIYENTNIIVVSDHGMTQLNQSKWILIDKCLTNMNKTNILIADYSPILSIFPVEGGLTANEIMDALKNCHPNLTMYFKQDIPDVLQYSWMGNQRIPPIIGIADLGWYTTVSADTYFLQGDHGYITSGETDMMSIFLAHGPNIKPLSTIDPFSNLEYFNFFTHLLNFTTGVSLLPTTNSTNTLVDSLFQPSQKKIN